MREGIGRIQEIHSHNPSETFHAEKMVKYTVNPPPTDDEVPGVSPGIERGPDQCGPEALRGRLPGGVRLKRGLAGEHHVGAVRSVVWTHSHPDWRLYGGSGRLAEEMQGRWGGRCGSYTSETEKAVEWGSDMMKDVYGIFYSCPEFSFLSYCPRSWARPCTTPTYV